MWPVLIWSAISFYSGYLCSRIVKDCKMTPTSRLMWVVFDVDLKGDFIFSCVTGSVTRYTLTLLTHEITTTHLTRYPQTFHIHSPVLVRTTLQCVCTCVCTHVCMCTCLEDRVLFYRKKSVKSLRYFHKRLTYRFKCDIKWMNFMYR